MRARPNRWPVLRVAVAEESMTPALRPGDWLLAWRTGRVRPGQVVLAWHPQRPGFLLVKRVAWREDGGWWLASDNPGAGAVDSARFGPVPAEKHRRGGAVPLLAGPSPVARSSSQRERGAAAPENRGPRSLRSGVLAGRWCLTTTRVGGGTSSSPDCALTSSSISSRGSLTATAQK